MAPAEMLATCWTVVAGVAPDLLAVGEPEAAARCTCAACGAEPMHPPEKDEIVTGEGVCVCV